MDKPVSIEEAMKVIQEDDKQNDIIEPVNTKEMQEIIEQEKQPEIIESESDKFEDLEDLEEIEITETQPINNHKMLKIVSSLESNII